MKINKYLVFIFSLSVLLTFIITNFYFIVFANYNLVANKLPTSSAELLNNSRLTDGDKNTYLYTTSSYVGLQWVQIDLGLSCNVNDIKLWHYYGDTRSYHDVIVQLSNDDTFSTDVTTVFNNDTDNSAGFGSGTDNEYIESSGGKDISFNPVYARYVRFYTNGNSVNAYNHYVEVEVYDDPTSVPNPINISIAKLPTSSAELLNNSRLTDGDKNTYLYTTSSYMGSQWLQIDLGYRCNISDIKLWHYYGDTRSYHDVIVQLSNDSTFSTDVTTVFNNDTDNSSGFGAGTDSEYIESIAGKDISFTPVYAGYVRFYTNGNTVNAFNHYVEVEIYGIPTSTPNPSKPNPINLAAAKLPTSSVLLFNNSRLTDGDKNTYLCTNTSYVGSQWVQIDLGYMCNVNDIKLWHYYGDTRSYHDVIVQLSNDSTFSTNVTTVFNNDTDNSSGFGAGTDSEYIESIAGKDISFTPIYSGYVRFYTNGNTVNAYNHYVEVEIYGIPTSTPNPSKPNPINLAASKLPTSSTSLPKNSRLTDGDKNTYLYTTQSLSGSQWVQIDLGSSCNFSDIKLWHYYGDTRSYHDVIVPP